ncbi:MAG TPA: hypothetical protein VNK95_06560, partial [Caldilineaceae bacterium]|nr:hypothetical protein [Caldilineaceae bacterium]
LADRLADSPGRAGDQHPPGAIRSCNHHLILVQLNPSKKQLGKIAGGAPLMEAAFGRYVIKERHENQTSGFLIALPCLANVGTPCGLTVTAAPSCLILFFLGQKYFVQGIVTTGLKG